MNLFTRRLHRRLLRRKAGATAQRRLCALCVLCGSLASCVPWTIVPIEDEQTTSAPASDPATYVESIWTARLLPAALAAPDLATVRTATAPTLVTVRAQALNLDTTSRIGKLLLDLEPADGQPDAALLTGPVILATSVRDAAGFIEFTDFANQLDYADVSNELNQRVLDTVLAPLDLESLLGRTLSVHGAWTPAGDALPEIVPLHVEVE
jgi:predicted lipoprotein